jgi:hypothetical protein
MIEGREGKEKGKKERVTTKEMRRRVTDEE